MMRECKWNENISLVWVVEHLDLDYEDKHKKSIGPSSMTAAVFWSKGTKQIQSSGLKRATISHQISLSLTNESCCWTILPEKAPEKFPRESSSQKKRKQIFKSNAPKGPSINDASLGEGGGCTIFDEVRSRKVKQGGGSVGLKWSVLDDVIYGRSPIGFCNKIQAKFFNAKCTDTTLFEIWESSAKQDLKGQNNFRCRSEKCSSEGQIYF